MADYTPTIYIPNWHISKNTIKNMLYLSAYTIFRLTINNGGAIISIRNNICFSSGLFLGCSLFLGSRRLCFGFRFCCSGHNFDNCVFVFDVTVCVGSTSELTGYKNTNNCNNTIRRIAEWMYICSARREITTWYVVTTDLLFYDFRFLKRWFLRIKYKISYLPQYDARTNLGASSKVKSCFF